MTGTLSEQERTDFADSGGVHHQRWRPRRHLVVEPSTRSTAAADTRLGTLTAVVGPSGSRKGVLLTPVGRLNTAAEGRSRSTAGLGLSDTDSYPNRPSRRRRRRLPFYSRGSDRGIASGVTPRGPRIGPEPATVPADDTRVGDSLPAATEPHVWPTRGSSPNSRSSTRSWC